MDFTATVVSTLVLLQCSSHRAQLNMSIISMQLIPEPMTSAVTKLVVMYPDRPVHSSYHSLSATESSARPIPITIESYNDTHLAAHRSCLGHECGLGFRSRISLHVLALLCVPIASYASRCILLSTLPVSLQNTTRSMTTECCFLCSNGLSTNLLL